MKTITLAIIAAVASAAGTVTWFKDDNATATMDLTSDGTNVTAINHVEIHAAAEGDAAAAEGDAAEGDAAADGDAADGGDAADAGRFLADTSAYNSGFMMAMGVTNAADAAGKAYSDVETVTFAEGEWFTYFAALAGYESGDFSGTPTESNEQACGTPDAAVEACGWTITLAIEASGAGVTGVRPLAHTGQEFTDGQKYSYLAAFWANAAGWDEAKELGSKFEEFTLGATSPAAPTSVAGSGAKGATTAVADTAAGEAAAGSVALAVGASLLAALAVF